jgi:hypothetical protein
MTSRHMIPGLQHDYASCHDDSIFFAAIDAVGGWPLGYRFVGFEHTDTRAAGFTNSPHNDGWWTVVSSADDYYLWKLSPEALQRITDTVVASIRLPRVDAQKLRIKNSRGHTAVIQKTPAAPKET